MREQRAVVVTGATGGMGVEVARRLSGVGSLVLTDLEADRLEGLRCSLQEGAGSVQAAVCDLTDPGQVEGLAAIVADHGGLRSLVHTAGLSPKMAEGRRVLDVDLVGTARLLEALLPHVGEGSCAVCISSIAGYAELGTEVDALLTNPLDPSFLDAVEAGLQSPLDGATAYVLAKRGVMWICERLSRAWGERGGRLVSVAPGLIDTEMARFEMQGDSIITAMIEATPIKRPGQDLLPGRPSDVGALVAFLCSDDASFISGCDIRVDGGLMGGSRHSTGMI
jgi:NAD(P)-dependent dehydrogenase (short-subunit alcohol dehydrogenase family)